MKFINTYLLNIYCLIYVAIYLFIYLIMPYDTFHMSPPCSSCIFFVLLLKLISYTAQNTEILPNFLVWKICGNAHFSQSFGRFARRVGEIKVFYAFLVKLLSCQDVSLGQSLLKINILKNLD